MTKALHEGSRDPSPEQQRNELNRTFIETLREKQDDQQRDQAFREAARMVERQ